MRIAKRHLDRLNLNRVPVAVNAVLEAHEAGLLIVDGKLEGRLPRGAPCFLVGGPDGEGRSQTSALEITAQEILTKDRVCE